MQELETLRTTGSVLYLAAHPDDENSRIIAWLARGRGYRTGYLSLTRGDGGQNVIGGELREALGVIRTQELLEARKVDGGEQFFTRANDFGFSKTPVETLAIWDRAAVLADAVRVIRQFQPDVLLLPFSPGSAGETHGHHTASAQIAMEAFKLAGDASAYPEQLATLKPWQPRRVLLGRWRGSDNPAALSVDVGGYSAVTGESFGEIAGRSRTKHRSQAQGTPQTRGSSILRFEVNAGEPATKELLDGVDTTWARFPGGSEVAAQVETVLGAFHPSRPVASVPALLELRRRLAALPEHAIVLKRREQLDGVLQACLGLYVETTAPQWDAVPGEELALRHTAIARAEFPVTWKELRLPAGQPAVAINAALATNAPTVRESKVRLPKEAPPSQPYWLREPGTVGLYRVDDPALIGRAENPPALPVAFVFEVGGQTLVVADEPVQVSVDRVDGEQRRTLEIVPPGSLRFPDEVVLFQPGQQRTVACEITAGRANTQGVVRLEGGAGWTITPAQQPFSVNTAGATQRIEFSVTAPAAAGQATFTAVAEVDGVRFNQRRVEINYPHLKPLLLQPAARARLVCLDVQVRARRIASVAGTGDSLGESLARLGCEVTALGDGELTADRLRGFDAVVFGIRAFSSRPELARSLPALFAYVEQGGVVLVQYNTPERTLTNFAPFTLKVTRSERVTDENAAMTLLAPEHRVFTTPNRITADDFNGWVQERGLYFPTEWDARFTPLLACADPGESPKQGSLLVAQHGRGYFVYTGLSFFRQFPEGVPGAYRLMANLVSLGK